jgi:DNA-binding LacI/PurR family transcriptional regulator
MAKRSGKQGTATSIDVARLAGVSQSAVSRTFGGESTRHRVSDATRSKILRAAAELGYRPNAIARSLITRESRMVGVLFSYLNNPFYAAALEMLCHALQAKRYHALVFMMPDTVHEVEATVSDLLQYQVDGMVTASVELSSALCDYCRQQDIPIVMFNRTQDDPRLSSVTTDNVGGGRLVARHLLAGGFQRIAMIAGWEGASTNRDREFGFRAELEAQGARLFDRAVGHFHLERAADAARALFGRPAGARPDAVFVTNDFMAVPVMDVIRYELGLRIPEDVAVVGFDDTPMAALPTYDLTSVRQPLEQMVAMALRVLFDRIEGSSTAPEHVILGARLIERGSSRRSAGRPASGPARRAGATRA